MAEIPSQQLDFTQLASNTTEMKALISNFLGEVRTKWTREGSKQDTTIRILREISSKIPPKALKDITNRAKTIEEQVEKVSKILKDIRENSKQQNTLRQPTRRENTEAKLLRELQEINKTGFESLNNSLASLPTQPTTQRLKTTTPPTLQAPSTPPIVDVTTLNNTLNDLNNELKSRIPKQSLPQIYRSVSTLTQNSEKTNQILGNIYQQIQQNTNTLTTQPTPTPTPKTQKQNTTPAQAAQQATPTQDRGEFTLQALLTETKKQGNFDKKVQIRLRKWYLKEYAKARARGATPEVAQQRAYSIALTKQIPIIKRITEKFQNLRNILELVVFRALINQVNEVGAKVLNIEKAAASMSGGAESAKKWSSYMWDTYMTAKMVEDTGEGAEKIQEGILITMKKGIRNRKAQNAVLKTGLQLGHTLGVDAAKTTELLATWKMHFRMSNTQLRAASYSITRFAKYAGISGEAMAEIMDSVQELNQLFVNMIGPSARLTANIIKMSAYSKKFGLVGIDDMIKATASFKSFMTSSQEQQFLMMRSWQIAGRRWQELWGGRAMQNLPKFSKSMLKGYKAIIQELEAMQKKYGEGYANYFSETLYGKGLVQMKREAKMFQEMSKTADERAQILQKLRGAKGPARQEILTKLRVEMPNLHEALTKTGKVTNKSINELLENAKRDVVGERLAKVADANTKLLESFDANKITTSQMQKSLLQSLQENKIDLPELYKTINKQLEKQGKEPIVLGKDWNKSYEGTAQAITNLQKAMNATEAGTREQVSGIAGILKELQKWKTVRERLEGKAAGLGAMIPGLGTIVGLFKELAVPGAATIYSIKMMWDFMGFLKGSGPRIKAVVSRVKGLGSTIWGFVKGLGSKVGGVFKGLASRLWGFAKSLLPRNGVLLKSLGWLGKGLRLLGRIVAEFLTPVFAVISAIKGWLHASDILGQKIATFPDKLNVMAANLITGTLDFLTFGLFGKWLGPQGSLTKNLALWFKSASTKIGKLMYAAGHFVVLLAQKIRDTFSDLWLKISGQMGRHTEKSLVNVLQEKEASPEEIKYLKKYYQQRLELARKEGSLSTEQAQRRAYKETMDLRKDQSRFLSFIHSNLAKGASPAPTIQPARIEKSPTVPSAASGGLVTEGGLVNIHPNEMIVPVPDVGNIQTRVGELGGSQLTDAMGAEVQMSENVVGPLNDIQTNTKNSVEILSSIFELVRGFKIGGVPTTNTGRRVGLPPRPSKSKALHQRSVLSGYDNWAPSDPFSGALFGGANLV